MKIAYLNPWSSAAENQAFRSLRIAAKRIGHELFHCSNSTEVDACGADFVLATASTQPKLSDVPHYGVIHEPRERFLANRAYYHNLLSYDGYLTISESLSRFIRNITFAAGRPATPGFYYNTCQRSETITDLARIIASGKLQVTYFGTNWDKRREKLINLLSQYNGVQVFGPKHSWPNVDPRSYGGVVPFDGRSPQAKYAENGVGLCLLSDSHYQDDVISNRIFEIASVGAVAICPDIPWIHRYFGDSVYYVDQRLPRNYLVQQILRRRDEIRADPAVAIEKARRAKEIFDKQFAGEVLLDNAVAYHKQVSAKRRATLKTAQTEYCPLISVIIRCGSRPVETIRKAVESVSRQSYGRFEIIFVRYKEIDLSVFTTKPFPNIETVRVVDSIGGQRSTTLWAGLSSVRGQYFSVLDDDDWLFSNHFELLFRPLGNSPRQRFFAYSGCIESSSVARSVEGGGAENRRITHFGITAGGDFLRLGSAFASNCFVASADLLTDLLLQDPLMATAEDTYLIMSLLAQAEPQFSFAATSLYGRGGADQSNFSGHPSRYEDELTLYVRLHGRYRAGSNFSDTYAIVSDHFRRLPASNGPYTATEDVDRIVHGAGQSPLATVSEELLDRIGIGFDAAKSSLYESSEVIDSQTGACFVETPEMPWSYGAKLTLNIRTACSAPALIKMRVVAEGGRVGVGLLDSAEKDFLFRVPLQRTEKVQEVQIPITDIHNIGSVVVQNWDVEGRGQVRIMSLDVFADAVKKLPGSKSQDQAGNGSEDRDELVMRLGEARMEAASPHRYQFGETIEMTSVRPEYLGPQWGLPDGEGCWTIGPLAEMTMPLKESARGDIGATFWLSGCMVDKGAPELLVRVVANGHEVEEWKLGMNDRSPHERTVILPAALLNERKNLTVGFEVPTPRSPESLGWLADVRPLGIRIARALFEGIRSDHAGPSDNAGSDEASAVALAQYTVS